jgi:hypothetical protein
LVCYSARCPGLGAFANSNVVDVEVFLDLYLRDLHLLGQVLHLLLCLFQLMLPLFLGQFLVS